MHPFLYDFKYIYKNKGKTHTKLPSFVPIKTLHNLQPTEGPNKTLGRISIAQMLSMDALG